MTASTMDRISRARYFALLNAYDGNGMLDKTKEGTTGLKHSIVSFRCCCTITASRRESGEKECGESEKDHAIRTCRYSTSAFASCDDLLVVEGVFRFSSNEP
jgi:hypothetical protein